MRKVMSILAVIGGVLAALGGLFMGVGLGLLALLAGTTSAMTLLQQATVALAIAFVGLGCGAGLIWAGVGALNGSEGRPLRLPGWGWLLAAVLVVLAVGQVAFNRQGALTPLLPVFHLLAGALGAFLFLAIAVAAARSKGDGIPARSGVGALSWGALGATGIAFFLEALVLVAAAAVAAIWLSATQSDLVQQLETWATGQMQNPGGPRDLGPLLPLLTSPGVILAILLGLGVVVPLIEEGAKSLAVPLAALARSGPAGKPLALTRLDGFLLGVASGAGFALLEGLLNGSLALAQPGSWGSAMLLRSGTAALHCLAAGLGGLGWQMIIVERRTWRGLELGLAAVALHGIWNAAAAANALFALAGQAGPGSSPARALPQVSAMGFMGLLWVLVAVALPLIARQLATTSAPSVQTIAADQPSVSPESSDGALDLDQPYGDNQGPDSAVGTNAAVETSEDASG